MKWIQGSLEILSWEKKKLGTTGSARSNRWKLDEKARQIPTSKEEHDFNTSSQQPWTKKSRLVEDLHHGQFLH